jgi:DNA repair exonuclease SbcCD ATPase subunit
MDETCPLCKQELQNYDEIQRLKSDAREHLTSIRYALSALSEEEEELQKNQDLFDYTNSKINKLKMEIDIMNENYRKYNTISKTKLDSLENEASQLAVDIENIMKEYKPHLWWRNEGFGTKGIKDHVINYLLIKINQNLSNYCDITGLSIYLDYDPTKSRKGFNVKCFKSDKELNYNELSGGEKTRAEIVTSFAIHDVVNNLSESNLLFLDEAFENLDQDGLYAVMELLRLKSDKGMSIFVITFY